MFRRFSGFSSIHILIHPLCETYRYRGGGVRMDLESLVEGPVAARHRAFMEGTYAGSTTCYVKFDNDPLLPICYGGMSGAGNAGSGGFGPRRDDLDQRPMTSGNHPWYGAQPLAPYNAPEPLSRTSLNEATLTPLAPAPFKAPTRETLLEPAPPLKPMFDKPFEHITPIAVLDPPEPLYLRTNARSTKLFDSLEPGNAPLARLDYTPEPHLQLGGTHTSRTVVGKDAGDVLAELLTKTRRPLAFVNPLESTDINFKKKMFWNGSFWEELVK